MSSDYLDAHLHVPRETKNLRANFFHRSDLSSCHMQLDHQTLVYCLFQGHIYVQKIRYILVRHHKHKQQKNF